jgi:hypothetical protein
METTLKSVDKLIDKFILPMDEDIMEEYINMFKEKQTYPPIVVGKK